MNQRFTFSLTLLFVLFGLNCFSTGNKIIAYFNHPVNTSLSTGVNAVYLNETMDDTLVQYINRAQYSLDIAVYDYVQTIDIADIAGAVNNAYSRGVKVRWIYDGSSSNTGVFGLTNGIHTLASPTAGSYGIMHNKFMVIDANSTNPNDATIWTGSTNWDSEQFRHDVNNVLIIQDQSLAQAYTAEFNQMWGDTGTVPNLTFSKFGPDKTDIITHNFTIDGKNVELYFSPYSHTNTHIQSTIATANQEIYFGVYAFTVSTIAGSIQTKIQSGVFSHGIMDNFSTTYTAYSILSPVMNSNLQVFGGSYIYHNKMMIVDPNYPLSDPLVETGSHNWSNTADTKNDENALIIHDSTIANIYYQSFWQNFYELDPNSGVGLIQENSDFLLYPNPSTGNFYLQIKNSLNRESEIEIMNTLGERVYQKTILSAENEIRLENVSAGIYFLRIKSGEKYFTIKLVKE